MPSIDEIKTFAASFGFKPFITKSELNELPKLLTADESLLAVAEGALKYVHNKKEVGVGIVFVTKKRVVFFRKSIIGTTTKEEFPIGKLSAASVRKGLAMSSIFIRSSGDEVEIANVDKKQAEHTAAVISELMNNYDQNRTTTVVGAVPAPVSVSDELIKLADLKAKGILTEEEFLAEKQKLLSR